MSSEAQEHERQAEACARQGEVLGAIARCKALLALDPRHQRLPALLAELFSKGGTGARVPPFCSLKEEAFRSLLEAFSLRELGPRQTVVREGEEGDRMYGVAQGKVEVLRLLEAGGQRPLAQLGPGEFFGELALLGGSARLATVVTLSACRMLELTRAKVESLVARHPEVGAALADFYQDRLLENVLRSNPLLASLPEGTRRALCAAFKLKRVPAGELLVEFDQPAESFYLLLRGVCIPFRPRPDGRPLEFPPMEEGDVFGEISLLLGKATTASVRAGTECTVLWLGRADFERLVADEPALKGQLMRLSFERLQKGAKLLSGRFAHRGDTRV